MPEVGVLIRNISRAPLPVVESAEAECRDIFLRASVNIRWMNADQDVAWIGPDLVIRGAILDRTPASRRIDTFGVALPAKRSGIQFFLYYDRVIALSSETELPPSTVLAGGIAHEIGHMLLASPAHTATGIMRADWRCREWIDLGQGLLRFTADQRSRLRILRPDPTQPLHDREPTVQ